VKNRTTELRDEIARLEHAGAGRTLHVAILRLELAQREFVDAILSYVRRIK
jgi:hypothetical protein